MILTWDFKTEIVDENVFGEIEKDRGVALPKELIDFLKKSNGGYPSKELFKIGNDEKVLNKILSVNKNDVDNVFDYFNNASAKRYFPLALDPFGNVIYYNLKNNKILFWDHEVNDFTEISNNLTDFLNTLYN